METGHQIPRSVIYDIVLRFLYFKIRNKGVDSEASSRMSYTLIYVSLAELVTVCRIGLREPMHLCDCMHKGGGGEEEVSSLLSYTLRYVSLVELGTVLNPNLIYVSLVELGTVLNPTLDTILFQTFQRAMTVQRINKKLLDTVP